MSATDKYLLENLNFANHSDMGGHYIGKRFEHGTMLLSEVIDEDDFCMPHKDATDYQWSFFFENDDRVVYNHFTVDSYEQYVTQVKNIIAAIELIR